MTKTLTIKLDLIPLGIYNPSWIDPLQNDGHSSLSYDQCNGHVIMDIECTHGMLEVKTGLTVIQSEKELLVIYIP